MARSRRDERHARYRDVDTRRVARWCSAVLAASSLAGGLFLFAYLRFIVPADPNSTGASGIWRDVVVFVTFLTVSLPLTWLGVRRSAARTMEWIAAGRTPTDAERARTLGLPARLAARTFVTWLLATAVFATGAALEGQTGRAVSRVALSITLGGLVSCTLAFYLMSRLSRPVVVVALAGAPIRRDRYVGVGPRLVLGWLAGSAVPLTGLLILPLTTPQAELADSRWSAVALAIVGLIVGALLTLIAARSVAAPLSRVRSALDQVRDGDLTVSVVVDDNGEIGLLQSGVNEMVVGLRERQRLADLFGRHVGAEVARHALEADTGLRSEQRDASVMFVDLVGSTALAEVLSPDAVVATLNALFDAVVRAVSAEGGWVNKFEGDGALSVFGAPAPQVDHAARALRAARALHAELAVLADRYPGLVAGIGVSSGVVVAGNVGTEQRYEYTVIGRPVNEAARLTELSKQRAGRILASGASIERGGDEAQRWVSLGTSALRGHSEPTALYEPGEVREQVPTA